MRNTAKKLDIITSFSSVKTRALSNCDGVIVVVLHFEHWILSAHTSSKCLCLLLSTVLWHACR